MLEFVRTSEFLRPFGYTERVRHFLGIVLLFLAPSDFPGTGNITKRHLKKAIPTNNALLMSFRLSSDAELFVDKRRPSIRIGAKRAKKNVYALRTCSN